MKKGIHFISGLPRSGSTLLAALLKQNPEFDAGVVSPVGSLFVTLARQMAQDNETAVFVDDRQRRAVLAGIFDNYYEGVHSRKTVFDTNRLWTAKLPALTALFPAARVICCVRHVPWIVDSVERLVARNAFEPSKIFNYDPGNTVYARYEVLTSGMGLLGFAWNALREAFYGPHSDRIMLLTYETLTYDPARAMQAVYDFIGETPFAHDFGHVQFNAAEFDARLGTPGLHAVRPRVSFEKRETVLPPDLFARVVKDSFWMEPQAQSRGVRIV